VFLLWPSRVPSRRPPRPAAQRLLSAAAVAVVGASLASGGAAFVSDLRLAFRAAGRSVLTPWDRGEMAAVREATRPGATLLLTSGPNATWESILWQRALYPDRTVIVLRHGSTSEQLASAKRTYPFGGAISIGDPPPDPGLLTHRDLGGIPGLSGRVWLGELRR
jgi:hypothetical protein